MEMDFLGVLEALVLEHELIGEVRDVISVKKFTDDFTLLIRVTFKTKIP